MANTRLQLAAQSIKSVVPRKSAYLSYMVIAMASFLPYLGADFLGQGIYEWVDAPFMLYPPRFISDYWSSWSINGLGAPLDYSSQMPLQLLFFVLDKIGVPLLFANRVFFVLPILLRGIGMYYLLSSIKLQGEMPLVARLLPSLFYVLVPLDVYGAIAPSWILVSIPLILGVILRWESNRDRQHQYAIAFGVVFVTVSFYPVSAVYLVFLISVYSIIRLLRLGDRKRYLLFLAESAFFSLIAGAYWLTGLFSNFAAASLGGSTFAVENALANLQSTGSFASLLMVTRLLYPLAFFYNYDNFVMQFIGYAIMIYAFSITVLHFRHKEVLFFSIIGIVSLVLSTGLYYTLSGDFYLWGFTNSNPLVAGLFRHSYQFLFLTAIAYAVLMSLTTAFLVSVLKDRKLRILVILFVLFLVFSYVAPVVAGHGFRPSGGFTLPESYNKIQEFLIENYVYGERVLIRPGGGIWFSTQLQWAPLSFWQYGEYITKLSPAPTIGGGALPVQALSSLENVKNSSQSFELWRKYGVKYVLVHKDLRLTFGDIDQTRQISTELDETGKFAVLKTKELDLFILKEQYTIPPAFAVSLNQSFNSSRVYLPDKSPNLNYSLSYTDTSLTEVRGSVNTVSPFLVIINQAFDKDWKIFVDGKELPTQAHVEANGYSNAWVVNRTGFLSLTISYSRQSVINLGYLVSGIYGLVVLCVVVYLSKRELREVFIKIHAFVRRFLSSWNPM